MRKKNDLFDVIERQPWKVEGRYVLDIYAKLMYCYAVRQVVGPYYLLRSSCAECPLRGKGCAHVTANGWLFVDNLPDCAHDMPCYSGSALRYVYVLKDLRTGRVALSGNYHEGYDFCRFIMGLPDGFDEQDFTPEQLSVIGRAVDDGLCLKRCCSVEDGFEVDSIALSCLEELPEDPKEALELTERVYGELLALLPVRYTVEDYLPVRRLNFLRMYCRKFASAADRYVSACRRRSVLERRCGGDAALLERRLRPFLKEYDEARERFLELLPAYGKDLLDVLRRFYPRSLDAALMVEDNPDYLWAGKIVEFAAGYEQWDRSRSDVGLQEWERGQKAVLVRLSGLASRIMKHYRKTN